MTAAPPEVRAVLEDLAARAPVLDVTATALRTADRRRHRRYAVTAVTVALVGLAVVALPTVAVELTSGFDPANSDGRGQQYDPDVMTPWSGIDDLPRTLDEPVAMVLSGSGSGALGGDDLVVTASGRVFRLPGSMWWGATISPDGHVLVWYDATEKAFTSRDLRNGTTHRYSPIHSQDIDLVESTDRPVVIYGYPSAWSPDGTQLAVLADGPEFGPHIAVVFDVATGGDRVIDITDHGDAIVSALSWRDDETMLVPRIRPASDPDDVAINIAAIGLDGSTDEGPTIELPDDFGGLVISPDERWIVSTSTGFPTMDRWDATSGVRGPTLDCTPCLGSVPTQWASARELVMTSHGASPEGPSEGYPVVTYAVDIDTGTTRPLVAVSPDQLPRQVIFARDLLEAGPSHSPHTSIWWPGWYLEWITYIAAAIAVLVGLLVILRHRRRLTAPAVTGAAAAGRSPER